VTGILTCVLVDTELELIPEELWKHPVIRNDANRRKRDPPDILLDSTIHHGAMKHLEEGNRRGRPDLVHMWLLNLLDSTLNTDEQLQVFLHLRDDRIVHVDPEVRIPRAQKRFYSLMEQLLAYGQVPVGEADPLMRVDEGNMRGLVDAIRHETEEENEILKVVALKEGGRNIFDHYPRILTEAHHIMALFGGFPRGEFKHASVAPARESLSLHKLPVSVWCAAAEVASLHRYLRHIKGIEPPEDAEPYA